MAILFERIEESNMFGLGCQLITRSWQLSVWRILSVWLEWIGKYPWLSRKLRRVWTFTIQHSYNLYLCKFCFRTCSHACSVVFDLFFPCLFFLQTMQWHTSIHVIHGWYMIGHINACFRATANLVLSGPRYLCRTFYLSDVAKVLLHVYNLQTDPS